MNFRVRRLLKHWLSRKYNLASYIRIEEEQIFFNLDEQALREIHQARIRNYPLYISFSFRVLLLHHVLSHIKLGLTFYTCYVDKQENQKFERISSTLNRIEKKKLLRSVVSPDGDVLNQISNSSLHHPHFLEISAAHHWLATQLLRHLHFNLNWIPRLIWFAFTISYSSWWQGIPSSIIIRLIGYFVPPLLFRGLWIWLQPLVIRWFLARIFYSSQRR